MQAVWQFIIYQSYKVRYDTVRQRLKSGSSTPLTNTDANMQKGPTIAYSESELPNPDVEASIQISPNFAQT